MIVAALVCWPDPARAGAGPTLAEDAGRFVFMLSFGLPFTLAPQGPAELRQRARSSRAGLWVMLATIGFNALAGWTLIFGHFGAPQARDRRLWPRDQPVGSCSASPRCWPSSTRRRACAPIACFGARIAPVPAKLAGGVPPGHAHRRDDDLRGHAVQHHDPGHGPLRRERARRSPNRAELRLDHLHGAARPGDGVHRARGSRHGRGRPGRGLAGRGRWRSSRLFRPDLGRA